MNPLSELVRTRTAELGLTRRQLAERLGYTNIAKGCRRIDSLASDDPTAWEALLSRLPAALCLPTEVVDHAAQEARDEVAEAKGKAEAEEEARWRAAFRPHAIILTERTTPSPIFVAMIVAPEKLLRIDFDLSLERRTFIHQALRKLPNKLWAGKVPCFGMVEGLCINYTPDRAVMYDLDGQALELLRGAYRIGHGTLTIKGKTFPVSMLS